MSNKAFHYKISENLVFEPNFYLFAQKIGVLNIISLIFSKINFFEKIKFLSKLSKEIQQLYIIKNNPLKLA